MGERKIIKPDFIIVPYPLLEDDGVGPQEEKLYGMVYWFSKLKNEKCTASNVLLAALIKSSPKSVSNSLNKLEERGYILRTYKDEKRRNRDEIIPLIAFSKVPSTSGTHKKRPSVRGSHPSRGGTHDPSGDGQKKNKEKKNKKNTSKMLIRSRTRCRSCAYDEVDVEHNSCPWCGEATDISKILLKRKYTPNRRSHGLESIGDILKRN